MNKTERENYARKVLNVLGIERLKNLHKLQKQSLNNQLQDLFEEHNMAEGGGFEPPKGIAPFNDLANRRLQPLSHPSAGSLYVLSVLLHAVCNLVIQNDK